MSRLYNIAKYSVIFESQKKIGLALQMFHNTGLAVGISQDKKQGVPFKNEF